LQRVGNNRQRHGGFKLWTRRDFDFVSHAEQLPTPILTDPPRMFVFEKNDRLRLR
jgi:hypothetical protein